MNKFPYLLLALLLFFSCIADAATLEVRINQSIDDVEETVSNGSMYTDSSDLELINDGHDQVVGLRFNNITVPNGSTITNAYIRFRRDERDNSDTYLVIAGQSHANAPIFTNANYSVSSRNRTSATVSWHPGRWGRNSLHDTPNLRSIVTEIVGDAGWISGNSIVFMITGSGRRIAESYEGSSTYAPMLHIEYTAVATTPPPIITVAPEVAIGADSTYGSNAASRSFTLTNTGGSTLNYTISDDGSWLSCSPTTGDLSAGDSIAIRVDYASSSLAVGNHTADITISDRDVDSDGRASTLTYGAQLRVTPQLTGSVCGDVPVYTENLVNPAILLLLDVSGSMDWQAPLVSAEDNRPHTPDISNIVQEIVGRAGWVPNNSMSFILTRTSGSKREAVSHDASGDQSPVLYVVYDDGSIDGVSVDVQVYQDSDDAEENISSGSVWHNSNDLDIGEFINGLRFQHVDIPQGATILNAYIEFVISDSDSSDLSVEIRGEDVDNSSTFTTDNANISGRTKTTAETSWADVDAWDVSPTEKRITIGKDVLSELITDRSISWGFGTWTGSNSSADEYTEILVGTKPYSSAHEQALLDAIVAASPGGNTPLTPSLRAAKDYFSGDREDDEYGETYYDPGCQPKIVITITDGLGNTGTTTSNVGTTTRDLTTSTSSYGGISVVGVGFSIDDAVQLDRLAKISNEVGDADEDDDVYALHEVNASGEGVPFLANSKDELIDALNQITRSLKSQVFYGSAPAATTSVDYGNIVISAQFTPNDWSGDLIATEYSSGGVLGAVRWSAIAQMPAGSAISAYTVDGSDNVVTYASMTGLEKFYLCKPLGDIINSTPKVVGTPAFYYKFDDYFTYRQLHSGRSKRVFVGANDGALHAFDLQTGVEQWRFYPESLHSALNVSVVGTSADMCNPQRDPSGEYCHKPFVDGSPVAADVFDGSDWSTVLVTGLGKGGSAYFALDISGGGTFGAGTDATQYLWEFTDGELGFATSVPVIGHVGPNTGTAWGVYFGSGYSVLNQATKEAYLFGFDVADMSPLWVDGTNNPITRIKITTSLLQDDVLSSPLIVNYGDDSIEDYLYVGNLYGSMYRVANIGAGEIPSSSKLFDLGRTSHENPITAKAVYSHDETEENAWIYFGTGKYAVAADKTTMTQQYFLGLKDNEAYRLAAEVSGDSTYVWNAALNTLGADSEPIVELVVQTITVVDGGTTQKYRTINGCTNTSNSWLLRLLNSESGMTGSERVTSKPLVVGGVVFFTTFIPDTNVCTGNGEAWVYALDYKTGCPARVFDINGDGVIDSDDEVTVGDESFIVAGIKIGDGEASDLGFDGEKVWFNTTIDGPKSGDPQLKDLNAKLRSWLLQE